MSILRMHPYYISVDKIACVHFASKKVTDPDTPKVPGDTYDEKRATNTKDYVEVHVVGVASPIVFEKAEDIRAIKEALKL